MVVDHKHGGSSFGIVPIISENEWEDFSGDDLREYSQPRRYAIFRPLKPCELGESAWMDDSESDTVRVSIEIPF